MITLDVDAADLVRVALPFGGALIPPPRVAGLGARFTLRRPVIAIGFECRMRAGDTRIDIGLCCASDGTEPDIDALFFEYDAPDEVDSALAPVSFARLFPSLDARHAELERALDGGLRLLRGGGLSDDERRWLEGLRASLPEGALITDIGDLSPRGRARLRVGVVADGEALRARARIDNLAEIVGPGPLRATFDSDGDAVTGIEVVRDQSAGGGASWEALFAALERAGLADADRIEAALAWPGVNPAQLPDGRRCALRRGLSHVKLVPRGDGTVAAKVYIVAVARPAIFG